MMGVPAKPYTLTKGASTPARRQVKIQAQGLLELLFDPAPHLE